MDLAGKKVLVTGLGVTGTACASFLKTKDAVVSTYADGNQAASYSQVEQVPLAEIDLIVTSPGMPPHHPLLASAQTAQIPIWSEIELAWQARVKQSNGKAPAPWVVLTGTNGKTTTVKMLQEMLIADGKKVAVAGNVGQPVIELITDPAVEVFVLELSSYQLEFTWSMQADAAAVLNLAPDHLSWHGSLEAYKKAKAKIYNQVSKVCVYNENDIETLTMVEEAEVQDGAIATGFVLDTPSFGRLGLVDDILIDRAFPALGEESPSRNSAVELATLNDLLHLAGPDGKMAGHVIANALAAASLARAIGTMPDAIGAGLRAFKADAHRIELTGKLAGVTFYDDSKATNTHAAAAALSAFPDKKVVWIAGGLNKGENFDDFVRVHRQKLKAAVLIGEDHQDLLIALQKYAEEIPLLEIASAPVDTVMSRAVNQAFSLSEAGDTVLLSPACASMDQFESYIDRGLAFQSAVKALAEEN